MEKLHPGVKWSFRFRGYLWAFMLLMFFGWFIFPMLGLVSSSLSTPKAIAGIFILGLFIYLIIIIIFGEIYARMSYNRWFYEFTDTNLKLERGIIWKRYSNVPYERIQNVDIHRGILARILGFSTVMIQTAGYSYNPRGGMGVEGYIPGVDIQTAEKIRDFLIKKISKKSHSGL